MSILKVNKEKKLLSIEESIRELSRPLKFYSFVVIGINLLILFIGLIISFGSSETKKYSSFETCFYGMEEITSNNPSEDLINKNVIEDLGKKTFKVDSIHLVKVLGSFSCDVFVKNKKGVRRYQVALEKNTKFKYGMRILDVKGVKVDSRYQL